VPDHGAQAAFDAFDAKLDLVMAATEFAGDQPLEISLVDQPVGESGW
jgi:hypothetical protein